MTKGVERVSVPPKAACWICGLTAVYGEKLPGRRRKVRALCQAHADAIFGAQDPPWQAIDDKTQRDIVNDWLRGITILAEGSQERRPIHDQLAEIAKVNNTGVVPFKLVSPLLPGESHDLNETIRAQNRLHGREAMVHALVTQILIGWCAKATGETNNEVIQRPALTLSGWFDSAEQDQISPFSPVSSIAKFFANVRTINTDYNQKSQDS